MLCLVQQSVAMYSMLWTQCLV